MTTKPIVVGTDGSGHSTRTVEWAAREAVLRSAPLRIVAAAEILPRMSAAPQSSGLRIPTATRRRVVAVSSRTTTTGHKACTLA